MTPGIARSFRFRPPWWAFLLAALGCGAGIALGNWQAGRAVERRAQALAQRPETLVGEFLPRTRLLLDNKVHRGRPGYHVLEVLQAADGRRVLVNRGWAPAGATRGPLPPVADVPGRVRIEGLRLERLPHALEPAGVRREGRVWQNASVAEVAAWSGLALEPWILEQHSPLEDGLAREWPRADEGAERNEMYALQWYSLAGLSIALFVALNLRRERARA
jgi:cytochrome oxidase assembly protein ShyY1